MLGCMAVTGLAGKTTSGRLPGVNHKLLGKAPLTASSAVASSGASSASGWLVTASVPLALTCSR
jgi:hypothetical protein